MSFKVLVVDDSSFFRRRVTDILNSDSNLEVIDVAVNGIDAVEKAIALKPDVITMDIEMPLLNGIDAVKQIMAKAPTAIIMFSSLTHDGAQATLDALDAGALDFLPKKFNEIAKNTEDAGSLLRERVVQLAKKRPQKTPQAPTGRTQSTTTASRTQSTATNTTSAKTASSNGRASNTSVAPLLRTSLKKSSGKEYKLLAIGTSTGGPVALQKLLTELPQDFPLPIIIVQHMPAAFTLAFANRLNSLCKINIKQACSGDILKPGCAYLAPGGKQMIIDGSENAAKLRILEDNSERIAFKPSVDISFASAAKVFGGNVLGIILTGMGTDGREGSRMLKSKGATIWAQNEETCVVYGMPQAVATAGIAELSLALERFPATILTELQYG